MKKFFMIASGLIFFAGMTALSGCGTEQAEVKEEVKADTETQVSDKSQEKAESAGESDAVEESGETSEQESLMGNFVTKTLEGEEVTQEIFSEANLTMVNIWELSVDLVFRKCRILVSWQRNIKIKCSCWDSLAMWGM